MLQRRDSRAVDLGLEVGIVSPTVGERMVWRSKDPVFGVQWAEWLDPTLPNSHGIRRGEDAKLFFPKKCRTSLPRRQNSNGECEGPIRGICEEPYSGSRMLRTEN